MATRIGVCWKWEGLASPSRHATTMRVTILRSNSGAKPGEPLAFKSTRVAPNQLSEHVESHNVPWGHSFRDLMSAGHAPTGRAYRKPGVVQRRKSSRMRTRKSNCGGKNVHEVLTPHDVGAPVCNQELGSKSFASFRLRPKHCHPWVLGVHHCIVQVESSQSQALKVTPNAGTSSHVCQATISLRPTEILKTVYQAHDDGPALSVKVIRNIENFPVRDLKTDRNMAILGLSNPLKMYRPR